ncbi:hypothetical protein P691DRAFT_773990 [Macrolepiota fuliginosa MF-IS2]|uniref:DUF6534 domain-containing protein n=1 Tax=Macrolepiota fuliginosa MF-IS2 TaxID=1400762 RepID=A0A9P5XIE5_9AGAR|nr:hypothetical protein P691DRAFT_773990 [Macrolepiota fuliginosa MF-IS2]
MPTLAQQYIQFTGPIFLGTVFNWCLLGTLFSQLYTYVLTYPEDTRHLKFLVGGLSVLEVLQTVLTTHHAWEMLVAGWGDTSFDRFLPWSAATFPIMTGLIALIVQVFFAWRIWVLRISTNYTRLAKVMSVLIATIAVIQAAAAFYGGVSFGMVRSWEHVAELTWIVEIWLSGSLACDILIAATMITILIEASRDSPWNHTAAMINKLIVHAIETGAVTAITALVDLIFFELYKDTSLHQAPALLLGKLYTNALMVSLNGRQRRRDSIEFLREQSALSNIRTITSHTGDYELTLRSGTPSRLGRSKSKEAIVVHMPIDDSDRSSLSKIRPLDSPV